MIRDSVGPAASYDDEIIWKKSESGIFSLSMAVGNLQTQAQGNFWKDHIWFRGCIMKHSICLWMAIKDILKTKDILGARGVQCNPICVLCNSQDETSMHLFISCPYASNNWNSILSKFNSVGSIADSLMNHLLLFLSNNSISDGDRVLLKLSFLAFCWEVWHERNLESSGKAWQKTLEVNTCLR